MKKIYVLNGPNLNMLGIREPEQYGNESYAALEKKLKNHAKENNYKLVTFQSNHEGELIDKIHEAYFKEAFGIVKKVVRCLAYFSPYCSLSQLH